MASTYSTIPSAAPQQTGPARVEFPFLNMPVPDKYARVTHRPMFIKNADYPGNVAMANRTTFTNLVTYSEDYSQAVWSKTNVSRSVNVANPKDGAITATTLTDSSAGAIGFMTYDLTVPVDTVSRTVSVFMKAGTSVNTRIQVVYFGGTTLSVDTIFNPQTGAWISGQNNITAIGGGWYRVTITLANNGTAGSTTLEIAIYPSNASVSDLHSVVVWGAQIVAASSAGPYIATSGLAVSVSAPDTDYSGDTNTPPDPFAYLCEEGTPPDVDPNATAKWLKSYARIPADQVSFSSRAMSVPSAPGGSGDTYSVRNFPTTATPITAGVFWSSGFFTEDSRVFAPLRAPGVYLGGYATAGTFTVTYKANTTGAINYNASGATVAAAINALASVISDGITVTINNSLNNSSFGVMVITLTVGTTTTSFVMTPTGLTVNTSKKSFTDQISSTVQNVKIADHLTVVGHGYTNSGQSLLLTQYLSSVFYGYIFPTADWGVADANTLQLARDFLGGSGSMNVTSFPITYAAPFLKSYFPGVTQITTRITQKFYLPGVTEGITTGADIPKVQTVISDAALLEAILNDAGYSTVDFQGPEQWLGPIYRTVQTEANLDEL